MDNKNYNEKSTCVFKQIKYYLYVSFKFNKIFKIIFLI